MIRTLIGALIALVLASTAYAQGSYRITPGDMLQIEVLEDPSLNRQALVLPDGSVSFPLAGTIHASGRSIADFQSELTQALASNFAAPPTVFVTIAQLAPPREAASAARTIDVYALGEFAAPGRYEIQPGTSLLQFLAATGGVTRFAAIKRIQLRRRDASGNERVYRFNYRAVEQGVTTSPMILQSGDVVVIPERRLFE